MDLNKCADLFNGLAIDPQSTSNLRESRDFEVLVIDETDDEVKSINCSI